MFSAFSPDPMSLLPIIPKDTLVPIPPCKAVP